MEGEKVNVTSAVVSNEDSVVVDDVKDNSDTENKVEKNVEEIQTQSLDFNDDVADEDRNSDKMEFNKENEAENVNVESVNSSVIDDDGYDRIGNYADAEKFNSNDDIDDDNQKVINDDENQNSIVVDQELEKSDDNDTPPPPPDAEPPSYEEQREPTPEPPRDPSPEPEVLPVPDTTPSHNYHPRLCLIKKWADFQGYGFNLHAEKDKQGQFIGLVDDNSPAEDAGLKKGDRIIEVNGVNIEEESHQQVIQRIKAGGETTKMLVVDSETDEFYKNNGLRIHSNLPEVKYKETRERNAKVEPEIEIESEPMSYTPRQCHIVKWADFNGYGFNLHAEKERGGQYIGKIDANSPAEDGGLRENDRIIEVNGVNIENETHQQVIARIKAGGDETKLLVVDREADAYYKSKGITVSTSLSEVKYMQTSRRSPRSAAPAVTNGNTTPSTQPQPTRTEPVKEPTAQANGGDFLNMSAKEMRERLAQKKKQDPKQKSNLDFKSKYDIFQKM